MGDADGVHTAFSIALAGINTFVSDADVSVATFFITSTLDQLTALFWVASVTRTARTNCSVVDSAAVGINATCGRIFTQISAVWCSIDIDACRRWRAVSISIVADVRIMASNTSLLSISIPDQVAGASTDVASRIVFANGSVVAWVHLTFISVNTIQSSIVLIAQLAFTKSLAILHRTSTMRSTLYPITRTFTNKMNTFLVQRAVCIMKAVHLNTTPVLVVRVARVKSTSRTGTLPLVVHYSARCIRSTRLFFTRIDALRHSILVTGCIQRAVRIASRTFARVGAAREAISNKALRAATYEAADGVLTDSSGMARVVQALIDIFAAMFHCMEAWLARTVVERAQLVHLAVTVRPAANLAVAVDAELSGRAFAVLRACRHTKVVDTSFSNNATTADSTAPILNA